MNQARPRRRRSELQQLVDLIRTEVSGLQDAWVRAGVSRARTAEYETYPLTLAALSHVQSRLSPGRYWTLHNAGAAPSGTEQCLRAAAGICGNQAEAMVDVLRQLGCQARPVAFYFVGAFGAAASHAVVEVAWGGRWHHVDVTNGAVFRRPGAAGPVLLSTAEVLKTRSPRRLAVLNSPKPEFQMTSEFIGDPLDYLTSDPDVVIDGEGVVRLRALEDGGRLRFQLDGRPNYVGSVAASDGGYGSLRLRLVVEEPVAGLELLIAAAACAAGTLCVRSNRGEWEAPITAATSKVDLPARADRGHIELSMSAPAATACYVVFKSITLRRAEAEPLIESSVTP